MPVTNFTSVISAQSVGTADVAALAASFDKLSGSIDGATKKSNDLNAHPGFSAFADKVRQGIENPLAAVGDAVDSALKAIGPAGTAISAAGASRFAFARDSLVLVLGFRSSRTYSHARRVVIRSDAMIRNPSVRYAAGIFCRSSGWMMSQIGTSKERGVHRSGSRVLVNLIFLRRSKSKRLEEQSCRRSWVVPG